METSVVSTLDCSDEEINQEAIAISNFHTACVKKKLEATFSRDLDNIPANMAVCGNNGTLGSARENTCYNNVGETETTEQSNSKYLGESGEIELRTGNHVSLPENNEKDISVCGILLADVNQNVAELSGNTYQSSDSSLPEMKLASSCQAAADEKQNHSKIPVKGAIMKNIFGLFGKTDNRLVGDVTNKTKKKKVPTATLR